MLFSFFEKQHKLQDKKNLIISMIGSLHVAKDQKTLYINALDILKDQELEELFKEIQGFIEKVEMKNFEDIKKENFQSVAGMRKKEANEKLEELNSFSFLLHNL